MPDVKNEAVRSGNAGDVLLYNNQGSLSPDATTQVLAPEAGETEINIDYYVHGSTTYPGLSPFPTTPNGFGSRGPTAGLYDYSGIVDRSMKDYENNTGTLNFNRAALPTHLDASTDMNFVTVSDLAVADSFGSISQVEGVGPDFTPKTSGSSDHSTTVLLNGNLNSSVTFPQPYAGFSTAEEAGGGH